MSRIRINHEVATAPAGNALVKHPEDIQATSWERITIATIRAGQERRYGDTIHEAELCIEGGTRSTIRDFDIPFGTKPSEARVRELARVLVRSFKDAENSSFGARVTIALIEQADTFSRWHIKVVEPYTD